MDAKNILPATPVEEETKHTTYVCVVLVAVLRLFLTVCVGYRQPIVTGTSVVGIKYVDGVMLAADTLGSYGSLTRFTDLRRLRTCGKNTIVGAGGEYSDFQYISEMLDDLRYVAAYHAFSSRVQHLTVHGADQT